MDIDNEGDQIITRMIQCEVCSKNEAKYTCPRCELRTCSLECIKIHKKELECDGLRDKVKFKLLKNFDNIDLLNDYRFLEETARIVSKSVQLPAKSCYSGMSGTLPTDLYRLKCTASSRGVQLYFLPPGFTRHLSNTTYLDHETQHLYWRVEWVFPQAEKLTLTDERVLDSIPLSSCVHKYVSIEENIHPSLTFYHAAGHAGIKLLLKAERTCPDRYYMLDPASSLRENLCGKPIIEFPVIYVILNAHIYSYILLAPDEERKIKRRGKRKHHAQNKNSARVNNFFFSNSNDDEVESGEDISDAEETFATESFINKPGHKHPYRGCHKFSYRGRGRRRHYTRRGNMKRPRGMQHASHAHRDNSNEFSEHVIINKLSSVNIQSQ